MDIKHVQTALAHVGWYQGEIDGVIGRKTRAAIAEAENRYRTRYERGPLGWPDDRRLVGAVQAALTEGGFEPGKIDGYAGHNTREALATLYRLRETGSGEFERQYAASARSHPAQLKYPLQRDMEAFYGPAGGPDCTAGRVNLPYRMIIAWNRSQTVTRFSCHKKLADPMMRIFRAVWAHYGESEIERLELNIFGGCYNYRAVRGGTSLSTHAYGAAVDLNPEKNQLRWGPERAQFAGPEYEPFWSIVMANGATPAGYAWGRDWMHFQFARVS
jgi:D-alanyl-D-alanine carboxypeptidase-like protein/putative peptidoglycan binding protein